MTATLLPSDHRHQCAKGHDVWSSHPPESCPVFCCGLPLVRVSADGKRRLDR